jgi:ABC-type multidrug transport system ATPase subunit
MVKQKGGKMIYIDSCIVRKEKHFRLEINDLCFEKGYKYFIIGASGSGKSTLMRSILGLEECEGVIYKKKNEQQIIQSDPLYRKGLMYLSQEFALWDHLSVEEHINFTLSKGKSLKQQEQTDYYIALVNLEHRNKQKPHTLSGGEKQRLALSRALAAKPDYLFLDEPFANIDIVQADMLMCMLESEQKKEGFGMIKVTHHFVGIKDIHSIIIVLEEGKVTFQGTYSQIQEHTLSPWIQRWKELQP